MKSTSSLTARSCRFQVSIPQAARAAPSRPAMTLFVDSEIGRLRSVLVHEPGREIDRMVPSMMQDLLFDDILFGARAREEHRRFRQVLRFVADEVLDVQELLEEVLRDPAARNEVLSELATLLSWPPASLLALNELPPGRLAAGLVEGVERAEPATSGSLDSLYLLPPLPNWFFQRDPATGEGLDLAWARMRPTLEGGDVLVLSPEVLVIGYSGRTEKTTIERLAEAL